MATENPKTEKINAIAEDPDSIMLVVQEKKIKFIHSCKKKAAPTQSNHHRCWPHRPRSKSLPYCH
jgi:hypothetical protein